MAGLFACFLSAPSHAQSKSVRAKAAAVTLDSLLHEMTDAGSLARWPQPAYTNREASSYDRSQVAPGKPGWSANGDFSQYIRSEEKAGRKEQVMLDADGPGALVRFWLTASPPKKGTLRVYLDNSEQPTVTFDGFDLLTGGLRVPSALLFKHEGYSADMGGNTLYLPIPYAKHCKVTWEEGAQSGQRYYQINYRTYPAGTPVTTFTPAQLNRASAILEQTGRALSEPPPSVEGRPSSLSQNLLPQKQVSLNLPRGSSAVRQVELRLDVDALTAAEKERALRSVIIQFRFDGERTVWCPASDFFGTAVGLNELNNFYLNVGRDGTMRCRWVMPYRKSAQISLLNLGTAPVSATLRATTSPWQWDKRSMHFHANWHFESGAKVILIEQSRENTAIRDWNFIGIRGRGVYVGDSFALFNPLPKWYGEGDEKISVDGEALPSHLGTGTEDYYGYSYAPRGVFQTPFANHVRVDSTTTQGYNVMSRVRPLDGIPFRRSLQFDMELLSWRPTSSLTCAATTYWYGFPGATSNRTPQPEGATSPIQTLAEAVAQELAARQPRPGAIEAETLQVVNKSGDFITADQDMSNWDDIRWSRGHQLLGKTAQVGDFIEVEVPAPDDAPRQIELYPTQALDYGILSFSVNGQTSAATFDGYAERVQPGVPVKLGVFTPRDGKFLLRIEVSGFNPQAKDARTYLGIDYLMLTKP